MILNKFKAMIANPYQVCTKFFDVVVDLFIIPELHSKIAVQALYLQKVGKQLFENVICVSPKKV